MRQTYEISPSGNVSRTLRSYLPLVSGILGGYLVGLGGALLLNRLDAPLAALPGRHPGVPMLACLLGFTLIVLSVRRPFRDVQQRPLDPAMPRSAALPPEILARLWSSGQASRPTVDLQKIGLPPRVKGDLSLSQALEELRGED